MSRGSTQVVVRLPGDLRPRLEAAARSEGKTISDLLRRGAELVLAAVATPKQETDAA
jgi:predicted DNA-binding protein